MSKMQTGRGAALATMALAALAGSPAAALAGRGHGRRESRARAAHTLDGTETAHLRLASQHEQRLTEDGPASGPLRGQMQADLTVGATFTGSFTIRTRSGSITGRGTAKPRGAGRFQSFRGTLIITGGSGLYRHVRGRTLLYGSFDRRTFDVLVHTRGRLSY